MEFFKRVNIRSTVLIALSILFIAAFCFCSCAQKDDDSTPKEYSGPSITDLIDYDVPDGYFVWSGIQADVNGPYLSVAYAEGPKDEATESCLNVALLKYNDKATPLSSSALDGVSLEEEMEDTDYKDTIDVDGETGYITRMAVEGSSEKTLEITVEHDGAWFEVMVDVPVSKEREKAFYELVNSIRFK